MDWYSYGVFRFTREQIIWVYQNLICFDNGEWPPMLGEFITDEYDKQQKKWIKVIGKASSYTDAPLGRRRIRSEAYYIKPKTIIGELEYRLKRTGVDGKLLVSELEKDNMSYENLQLESQQALDYISLWDFRKRAPYDQWVRQRQYYRRKVSTYS